MPNPNEAPREVTHAASHSSGVSTHKTHPMLIIAAVAVTLFAGVGIGVMTGVIPSANSSASPKLESSTPPIPTAMGASAMMGSAGSNASMAAADAIAPAANTEKPIEKTVENKSATSAPNSNTKSNTAQVAHKSTSTNTHAATTSKSQTPTPFFAQNNPSAQTESTAPRAQPVVSVCRTCGTIDSINTIVKQGEGSGAGAVLGGVLGGVLGHQVGNGRGKDLATVAGAVGGAVLGNSVEKNAKAANSYDVRVRMDDDTFRTVRNQTEPGLRVGDKVRVEDGRIVRG